VRDVGGDPVALVNGAERLPAARREPGFLGELAAGGLQGRLAVLAAAGRDLQRWPAQGVAPLADQGDLAGVIERDDADGGAHLHDAVDTRLPVGADDVILPHGDPRVGVHDATAQRPP
jgi:hypothetical protein